MSAYDRAPWDEFAWVRPQLCGPNSGNCVEVNLGNPDVVAVRDTKLAGSPVLVFDNAEWDAFMAAARAGQFDR
ncbi:DUF397 domain-containing protein [Amycolatopsis rhabdoformis]|uniref:DUF397 domain-containing protein n=1 Tax=Amycolatopsis rhabdoformis TaxID=1448059 RepID=A0ABZ1I177_9PSEU|nr:DUF397 domain-containing protein [Amycolatopsis rhabdoformis]WSE27400.1 DUF397 domain-containing protein [Amycolatopsis rhabdoformis]